MTTVPLPRAKSSRSYAKRILWLALAAIAITAVITYDIPFLNPAHPFRPFFFSARFLLIPHILAAFTAVLVGPFQFSTRLRQRIPRLHRVLGRVYAGAVCLAAVTAFLMGPTQPPSFRDFGDTLAALWLVCTLAAFLTARNRQIAQHRIWAIRSYAVAFIFFFDRLPLGFDFRNPTNFVAYVYILMLGALVVPDIASHWQALTRRR
jgi:uncharacterized membrane protein